MTLEFGYFSCGLLDPEPHFLSFNVRLQLCVHISSQHQLFTASYFVNVSRPRERHFEPEDTLCLDVLHIETSEWSIAAHDRRIGRKAKGFHRGAPCSRSEKYSVVSSLFSLSLSFGQTPLGAPSGVVLWTYQGCTSFLCQHSSLILIDHPDRSSSSFSRALCRSVRSICVHRGQHFFNNTMAKADILARLTLYWCCIMGESDCARVCHWTMDLYIHSTY